MGSIAVGAVGDWMKLRRENISGYVEKMRTENKIFIKERLF